VHIGQERARLLLLEIDKAEERAKVDAGFEGPYFPKPVLPPAAGAPEFKLSEESEKALE
jgi:hypothetical protein